MEHNHGDQSETKKPEGEQEHTSDYAPYPKLDPTDVNPPPLPAQENWNTVVMEPDPSENKPASASPKSVSWSSELTKEGPSPIAENSATTMPIESNPYISSSPASSSSSVKHTVNSVRDVLGKWGKMVGEKTKKAEDLAGNFWQHMKTSPSLSDAAMGRIAQGTKALTEGGYEKIFQKTFETVPEERLLKSYACYLSTSAGPVMGILYQSTAKLAFCSDNTLSYKVGDQTEWSYYKVIIPLHLLKAVNPSTSKVKPAEKYIQVISIDNHEFWFMGFVSYDNAVKSLQEAFQARNSHPV